MKNFERYLKVILFAYLLFEPLWNISPRENKKKE